MEERRFAGTTSHPIASELCETQEQHRTEINQLRPALVREALQLSYKTYVHVQVTVIGVRVPVVFDPFLRCSDLSLDRSGIGQRFLGLELTTSLQGLATPEVTDREEKV